MQSYMSKLFMSTEMDLCYLAIDTWGALRRPSLWCFSDAMWYLYWLEEQGQPAHQGSSCVCNDNEHVGNHIRVDLDMGSFRIQLWNIRKLGSKNLCVRFASVLTTLSACILFDFVSVLVLCDQSGDRNGGSGLFWNSSLEVDEV
ncbi:hypothetical protein RSAG8_13929, partial [Rhizoctonia solani AG-8 WAC10335]